MIDLQSGEKKSSPDIFWQDLRSKVPAFVERAINFAGELGLDVSDLQIDHVGLRFKDPKDVYLLSLPLNFALTRRTR